MKLFRQILLILIPATSNWISGCKSPDKNTVRPNVLLAISDDQSWEHASAYGCDAIETPAFDRIAREGILFSNAFSAAPGCSPSRAAMLTGRYIWQLEEAGSHACSFPVKYTLFTDLLEEAGYHVGYTGKGWGPGRWDISGRKRNPAGDVYSEATLDPPEFIRNTDYTENFLLFLKDRETKQPFCFWYGASEPHRRYSIGIGSKNGMDPGKVKVPSFLPDTLETQQDMLDYMYEIQWFDEHLGKMIETLEDSGHLDNTVIIVTSDNGMPYPRAKANCYEYGIHMPLAIRWGDKVHGGRTVHDLVSLIDLAPTILEVTGTSFSGDYPIEGKSLVNIFNSEMGGWIDESRRAVFSGRERHSSSRWNNHSYPIRAMRAREYLYIRNFKPERLPAGTPTRLKPEKISWEGDAGGYHDIDDYGLSFIYMHKDEPEIDFYHQLATARRSSEELYDIVNDPGCIKNLADHSEFREVLLDLRTKFESYLVETGDPRMTGDGDVYETYPRYSPIRDFSVPEWAN
ncbi:sulfatase [Bacteroidota bacterium]